MQEILQAQMTTIEGAASSDNLKLTEIRRMDSLTSGTNMMKQSRLHGQNNDEVQ